MSSIADNRRVLSIPYTLEDFSIAAYLPPRQPLADRWPILALGLLTIYAISYLVHIPPPADSKRQDEKHPTSQAACYALLPVAVGAPLWFWLTVDFSGETTQWAARGNVIFTVMSSAIRWTFSRTRPSYHPLTQPPFFASVRRTRAFQALNLPLMEYRLHGLTEYSPPYNPSKARRYLPSVLNHLSHFLLRLLIFDALTLLIHALDPTNRGLIAPAVVRGDWDKGMETMSDKTGVPRWLMPAVMTVLSTVITWAGVAVGWDQHALLAVGSGLWAPEEWPKVMDAPWKSQSLNELWGRRYHMYLKVSYTSYSRRASKQGDRSALTLQNVFNTLTLPLSSVPRAFHIPRIFLGSAIHHSLLIYPFTGTFSFRANVAQYMLLALGCSLERAYYHATARRVGGPWGRLWTWTVFLWSCYFGTRAWYETGWAQRYRCDLHEVSPVMALLKIVGNVGGGGATKGEP